MIHGHLHRQLAALPERRRQPREQRRVVRYPLQGRVREHDIEPPFRERLDRALLKANPAPRVLRALRQHRLRPVHPHRLRRLRVLVQELREHARSAPQVNHSSAGNRLHERQQVVERLLALGAEARVLIRLPGVAHAREPTSACGNGSSAPLDEPSPPPQGGPAMVRWDEHTALVVVDVQNDFADPRGSLSVQGGDEIIPALNDAITAAEAAGACLIYTQDWHPPDTPHFEKDGGIWPVHCVQDSWGADLHPNLRVVGEVVRKGTAGEDGYSGFTVRDPASGDPRDTLLESLLRDRGIRTVVVGGLATDYCVRDTALDAVHRDFATFVLIDAVRAVDLHPGDGARAFEAMRRAGVRSA